MNVDWAFLWIIGLRLKTCYEVAGLVRLLVTC